MFQFSGVNVSVGVKTFRFGFSERLTSTVTALLGRAWCGWACPQTVYLEYLYRPIERLIEGNETIRKRRDEGPWTFDKIWRKTVKLGVFTAISLLLAHTFCDVQNGIEPLMSPYREYFEGSDLRESYAYYADLLRMIQWQRPGERWLLKSPAHLWAIDALVEMFPDVCIIQTHRDPMQILASYCSMMEALMSIRETVDRKELGRSVLEHLGKLMDRGLDSRDRSGGERFIDVDYARFIEDPLTAVRAIYDHFDIEMDDATTAALEAHVSSNPRGKHGKHEYDLSQYGLSAGHVRERLGGYLERFDLRVND